MSSVAKFTALAVFSVLIAACSPKGQADPDSALDKENSSITENAIAQVSTDLNGDGVTDKATLIAFSAIRGERAEGYKQVSAWPYYSESAPPSGPAEGGPVVLVIEHGTNENQPQLSDFILYDPNKVSVLATDAAKDLASKEVNTLPENGMRLKGLPESFTGKVLMLPTEAGIDTFIYWTGNTYRVYEPLEMP